MLAFFVSMGYNGSMRLKVCKSCGIEFNPSSPAKRRAGGLAIHCADCAQETTVRHLGVGDGCGKQTSVQILSFDNPKDKENFSRYWAAATGMHNGKASHMAYLPSPIQLNFQKVAEHGGNPNHKGKQ